MCCAERKEKEIWGKRSENDKDINKEVFRMLKKKEVLFNFNLFHSECLYQLAHATNKSALGQL